MVNRPIPNRIEKPYAKQHKDFVLVASANTVGKGANRIYVGRNAQDEASLDRFRIGQVEMDYDRALEAIKETGLKSPEMQAVYQRISFYRALEMFSALQFEGAMNKLKESQRYPKDGNLENLANYYLGETAYRLKEYEQARDYYRDFRAGMGAAASDVFDRSTGFVQLLHGFVKIVGPLILQRQDVKEHRILTVNDLLSVESFCCLGFV